MSRLPRPGDITVALEGEPVAMWKALSVTPSSDMNDHWIDRSDGLPLVIAHVNAWCLVLASGSQKMGWVYELDVGPSNIPGAVYSMRERSTM